MVTEQSNVRPSTGDFALYQLSKRDLGTPEAVEQIRRIWNLATGRIAHAGLKDRSAITRQAITIRKGPQTDLEQDRFSLTYQGQTDAAVTAANIDSNQFRIAIRQLSQKQAESILSCADGETEPVVPNYFDEQRFGSLGYSREFVASAWCRRDFERAVWLAMADANPHDWTDEKRQKSILRDHWGDWVTCKQQLSRSHRRSIVTYLVDHPEGFRKAFALIRPDLRGLYLSAFQSAVWNRMLSSTVQQHHSQLSAAIIADAEVPLGWIPAADIARPEETLPLVSARSRKLTEQQRRLANSATLAYGLNLPDMKISFPRDRFFSKSHRRCWLQPSGISARSEQDELHEGCQCVWLEFELPSGSYATMFIRGLTHGMPDTET